MVAGGTFNSLKVLVHSAITSTLATIVPMAADNGMINSSNSTSVMTVTRESAPSPECCLNHAHQWPCRHHNHNRPDQRREKWTQHPEGKLDESADKQYREDGSGEIALDVDMLNGSLSVASMLPEGVA